MAIGHKLSLRLFLEGIEVPVVGASINVAPNSPAAATIQVIATNAVLELLPRTVVHLFFYDFVDATSPINTDKKVANPGTVSNIVNEPVRGKKRGDVVASPQAGSNPAVAEQKVLYDQYKLLFMGEVQGIQFAKDAGSRSVLLSCVDFSNYWDTTYQYNFGGSIIGGRREAAFIGANANLFTSPLGHGEGTISALLSSKSVNFPKLQGLLGGIIRVLESIGGCYYTKNGFKGANDFCSIAELRLKILQQICAAEEDNSTAKLFSEKTFAAWMNRSIGGLGKLVTFRGLVDLMQRFIYHEVYPCPSPKFVPEVTVATQRLVATNIKDDPRSASFAKMLKELMTHTQYADSILSRIGTAQISEAYETSFTNTQALRPPLVSDTQAIPVPLLTNTQALRANLDDARKLYGTIISSNMPKVPEFNVTSDMYRIDRLQRDVATYICRSSAGYYALDTAKLGKQENREQASAALVGIIDICAKILGYDLKHLKNGTDTKAARVNNQIFRPDIWYAPPPRCNVLFPELYNSMSWSRNYMREVSRLELQSTNSLLGDDALFNGRYYAPNVADMRRGIKLDERKFNGLIMQHELYTGIIPMYEKMSELNLFGMQAGLNTDLIPYKTGYGQRAANHQYFKHRFASRQMQCTGRFNPWIVPGFPTLILDRPLTTDELGSLDGLENIPVENQIDALRNTIGPQFLGTCVQVSHSVNQQGGTTSYAFMQARVHRESTESLGVDKELVSKVVGTAKVPSVILAMPSKSPRVGSKGPKGGKIVKVSGDVSAQNDGHVGLLWPDNTQPVKIDVGAIKQGLDVPHAYAVLEQINRRQKTAQTQCMEDAIRPPWIWTGWHNESIGNTYYELIGTDSLVDFGGIEKQPGAGYDTNEENAAVTLNKADGVFETNLEPSTTPDLSPVIDRPKVSGVSRITTDPQHTIEASVDYLVRTYSTVRYSGLDVGAFIRQYTWRPIATMTDILGSPDLDFKMSADKHVIVSQGTEGFHSRAFSDQADLFGLVNPNVKKVLGLSEEKDHATLTRLDVRAERRAVVRQYAKELQSTRGLLG